MKNRYTPILIVCITFFISGMLICNSTTAQVVTQQQLQFSLQSIQQFSILSSSAIKTTDTIYLNGDVGSLETVDAKIITDGCVFKDGSCVVKIPNSNIQKSKK